MVTGQIFSKPPYQPKYSCSSPSAKVAIAISNTTLGVGNGNGWVQFPGSTYNTSAVPRMTKSWPDSFSTNPQRHWRHKRERRARNAAAAIDQPRAEGFSGGLTAGQTRDHRANNNMR